MPSSELDWLYFKETPSLCTSMVTWTDSVYILNTVYFQMFIFAYCKYPSLGLLCLLHFQSCNINELALVSESHEGGILWFGYLPTCYQCWNSIIILCQTVTKNMHLPKYGFIYIYISENQTIIPNHDIPLKLEHKWLDSRLQLIIPPSLEVSKQGGHQIFSRPIITIWKIRWT